MCAYICVYAYTHIYKYIYIYIFARERITEHLLFADPLSRCLQHLGQHKASIQGIRLSLTSASAGTQVPEPSPVSSYSVY